MSQRPSPEPLLALILGERPGISPRDKAILVEWLTLGDEAGSLAAIGRRYCLTRERVRQVVRRGLAIVDEWTGFSRPLRRRLESLRAQAPVPLARLAKEPWAAGLPPHGALLVAEAYSELRLVRDPRLGDCLMPIRLAAWRSVEAAVAVASEAFPPDACRGDVFRTALDGIELSGPARDACLRALDRIHAGRDALGLQTAYAGTPVR